MNKKVGVGIFCFLLVSVLVVNIGFVSAQNQIIEDIGKVFSSSYEIIGSVISNLLKPLVEMVLSNEEETLTNDLLFAKLLFLLIVLGIVNFALRRVSFFDNQNQFLYGVIVFAVAVLATRWLGTAALINMIILPYSVVGIVISAGLPFIIYFLFIEIGFRNTEEHDYSILRKVAWVLFIVVFIGLWYSRSATIQDIGRFAKYVYPVTLLTSVLILVFDGRIQSAWNRSELRRTFSGITSDAARALRRQLHQLSEDLQNGVITTRQYQAGYQRIRAQLRALGLNI